MREKATSATIDPLKPVAAARRLAPQTTFELRYLGGMPVMLGAAASDVALGLEEATEGMWDLGSNWNQLNNTSGIFPVPAIPDTDLLVDYVYTPNMGSRPCLDELCRIRRTITELFNNPFTTAPALEIKDETSEFQKPPTVVSRHKEVEWLSSSATDLSSYEGKWIAIEGSEILAWGSDEVEVEMLAREKGIKVPFLVRIPSKNDIPFAGPNLHDWSNLHDSNNIR